jgi:hypothetical protein
MYMEEGPRNVRTRKEIKKSLLKKAIKEGRGPEMISQILWRVALCKLSQEEKDILEQTVMTNEGQPRTVQMLNTIEQHNNQRYVYTKNTFIDGPPTIQ